MAFRKFLFDNLINNELKLYSFQIGCYPSSNESLDHQYPLVLKKYQQKYPGLKICCILIDKMYQQNSNFPVDKADTFIYPYYISEEEYNTIVEFCHFMSKFNTVSIIFEFTSIIREAYYDIENMTDYLYITPSNCMIETSNILFNPILNYNSNKFIFFRPDREDTLHQFINSDIEILDFVLGDLERRKEKLDYYISFLNIMRMDLEYNDIKIKKNFDIRDPYFYLVRKNIHYRLNGYDKESTKILMRNFDRSEMTNLETYVYNLVFNILYDCLVYKYKEANLINDNYDKILFDNDKKMKECIESLK